MKETSTGAGGRQVESAPASRLAVLAVALAAWFFVAGIYAVPLLEQEHARPAALLRGAYAPLCHQLVERSLTVEGRPQAVCARCAGLYLGGAAGLLAASGVVARRFRRPRARLLGFVLLPTVADAAAPWLGLPGLPSLTRLWIAAPAGFVAALFLAEGIADLVASGGTRCPAAHRTLEDVDG